MMTTKTMSWHYRYFTAHWVCRLAEKIAPSDCSVLLIEDDGPFGKTEK